MASNRHLGRIVALQTLYEYEFRSQSEDPALKLDEILTRNVDRYDETIDDKELDQIARIDRNILRMGLFELLHRGESVPPKVVINEAVELAKAFGSDNSSKFINGVLGTAYRTLVEAKDQNDAATAA
jgi:N utilization substance protein B